MRLPQQRSVLLDPILRWLPVNRCATAKGAAMPYFALLYDVVENFAVRRAPYREEHLRIAQEAYLRGELLLAGALGTPPDRALLIFHAADRSVVDDFARADPYVTNGLVTRWEAQPWAVVIGDEPAALNRRSGAG